MKIIITEQQYKLLNEVNMTEDKLRRFLYSLWNKQKKMGEEPHLDDVIYDVTEIEKGSREEYEVIRPIWFDYNGGYINLLHKLKKQIENKEFHIKGEHGLDMVIFVNEVHSYGEKFNAGMVEIMCNVVSGIVDGYVHNEETGEMDIVPNMDIFEQYSLLDYDTGDFEQYLSDETYGYFSKKLKRFGIPIHIDLIVKK